MVNDDNMDTTSVLTDKEQFSKEELLSIDQDNEENKVSKLYQAYKYTTSFIELFSWTF